MRALVTFLMLTVQFGLATEPKMMSLREDEKFSAIDLPQEWGGASNGICCALKISRDGTVAGGLPLELFFKNVGDKLLMMTNPYDLRDEPWIWTLSIVGPEGRVTYDGDTAVYPLTLKRLKPGQVVRYVGVVRSPVWRISEPGRYLLKVKYKSRGPKAGDTRPIWGGTIYSNEAEVILK